MFRQTPLLMTFERPYMQTDEGQAVSDGIILTQRLCRNLPRLLRAWSVTASFQVRTLQEKVVEEQNIRLWH